MQALYNKYNSEVDGQQWKYIFQLAYDVTNNTRIREFQTTNIHRVTGYPSKSYASKCDQNVNEM